MTTTREEREQLAPFMDAFEMVENLDTNTPVKKWVKLKTDRGPRRACITRHPRSGKVLNVHIPKNQNFQSAAGVQDHDNFNLKKLVKKIGAVGKKLSKTVLNPIVAIKKSAQVGAKIVKGVTAFTVLGPFVPAMKKALKSRGISPPGDIQKLAQLFYNTFVAKKKSSFEPINFDDLEGEENNLIPLAIIPPIIAFIKGIAQKKKGGTKLSPILQTLAADAINVQSQLGQKANKMIDTDGDGIPDTPAGKMVDLDKDGKADTPAGQLVDTDNDGIADTPAGAVVNGFKAKSKMMTLSFKNPFIIGGIILTIVVLLWLGTRK